MPLLAVQITFLVFAASGVLGFYSLLRDALMISTPASVFGATLYLFNGFYGHRAIVGHFTFHVFMLVLRSGLIEGRCFVLFEAGFYGRSPRLPLFAF